MLSAATPQALPLAEKVSELNETHANSKLEREPLTLDELIRQRASLGASQPVISYPHDGIEYTEYRLRQLDIYAFRVAKFLEGRVPPRASSKTTPSVMAMLGPSDLNYLVMLLALAKLGHTGLLLSTRISIDAYVSLLERTGSRHMFIHPSFKDTVTEIQKRVPELEYDEIPTREVYGFSIPEEEVDTNITSWLDPTLETKHFAWIIHSSGSTGLPKPIFHTQTAALKNYSQNMNMSGFITLPLYHNHGISVFFRTIHSCKRLWLYNANLPLTRQYLIDIMRSHEFEIFYGVPYALKLLAETEEGLVELAKLKAVMFGGSACPDSLGNLLVSKGVHLISHYGSTETGQLMTSMRPREDKEWDYVRPTEAVKPFLRFEERFPGVFEIICLDGWPSKVMTNRPDGSYAMKDLFVKHPTMEAYKYYARLDDTITLVNGEKVNSLDMEGRVRQHSEVAEAIAFGVGKNAIGLVVIRAPDTSMPDAELIDLIWPSIEAAHESMPAFGQLSRSMITILPHDTDYPRTDKGTVIRAAFYREFADLIDKAYETEEAMTGDLVLPVDELKTFLREQILELLTLKDNSQLTDDADFFALGMDSLQSTQLRAVILKTLSTNGNTLGLNIAFEHPTISALAQYLDSLNSGVVNGVESIEDQMASLITKYSQFAKHTPRANGLRGRYIVVTGGTGSLGSHVIAQLSAQEDVQKVYCLIRAGSPIEAYERLLKSMRNRKVYNTLSNAARSKLIALPSDFADPQLGLDATTYNTITSELTDVIHCAWSVNFNMHLSSFERDSIGGLKNLIDLCLLAQRPSPASFNFCSSISAVVNTAGGVVPEALPKELQYAQNMGYAHSKLVGENICVNAAQQAGVPSRVLRIGQVIGDQTHGNWNATEAIPLMLQSATTIGALPKLDESPLWLPVDVVAGTVIDISLSSAGVSPTPNPITDSDVVFNIVSQHAFHWTRDLLPYLRAEGLQFDELEQREWIRRLRSSNPDPVANPPIKLVDFFANKYDTDQPRRSLQWHTENARKVSATLAEAGPLSQELVGKMVGYFRGKAWPSS